MQYVIHILPLSKAYDKINGKIGGNYAERGTIMIDRAGILMAQGDVIASERIEGVNDNMSLSHYHDYYELYYLEKGERYHVVRDQVYGMSRGEYMLFPPYVMHHSFGEENVTFRRIILYFRKEQVISQRLLAVFREMRGIYKVEVRQSQVIHRYMVELMREMDHPSEFSIEKLHTILNMLLLTMVQQRYETALPEKTSRMSQMINYIHMHYDEEISIESLAQMFFISPYYLCREFKKYTNRTIVQYVNITRVMNAQRMFMETDRNVTEVSKTTGFSNITHFNRVFKGVTGMTPSGYRKSNRL